MVAYTYFSHRFGMRAKGKGWRLDYYLVRQRGIAAFGYMNDFAVVEELL